MRILAALTLLVLAPTFGACAAISRPSTTIGALERDAVVAAQHEQATRDSVIVRLVRRAERRGDQTLDILMLSGGGQNGAYGAGFLRGWHSRPDAPMPRFDLITGISTGSLQAPYALLGTTAALDTISELYREAADRVAPTIDWWFWARRTGGVVNTKRYDRALEQSINGKFRDDLRRAFADDRQIVFGTTDYDIGTGRTWSLGDALDTTAASLVRARTLLKAATAIPGIFPPVIVDGHVHGDGGVISNVLPLLTFADYQRLAQALAAKGMRDVKVNVYVIMNMWAHAEPKVMTPSDRKQISARSNMLLFYAHMPQTIELLDAVSRAVATGVPGLQVQFRVATLASDLSLMPGAAKLFDRTFIQQLDSIGFAKSRSAQPWDAIPSAYQRPPSRRHP